MSNPLTDMPEWDEEERRIAALLAAETKAARVIPPHTTDNSPPFFTDADRKKRDELIERYAYLVKITAERLIGALPPTLEREDLVSAGIVGLIKAVDRYNPILQVKFETYAIALIRGAILEMLRKEDWVPRKTRERISLLQRTYMELEMRLGRPASDAEMAAAMNVSPEELQTLLFDAGRTYPVSLEDALACGEGGEDWQRSDVFYDVGITPTLAAELRERQRLLGEAIDRLPGRERQVVALYYYEGMTFHEIGTIITISTTRAYQLHTRAMLRLRGHLQRDVDLF